MAANIAEGKGRGTPKEFVRYLGIADGSLTEIDTYYVIAQQLNYIDQHELNEVVEQLEELGRIITGLRKSNERRT